MNSTGLSFGIKRYEIQKGAAIHDPDTRTLMVVNSEPEDYPPCVERLGGRKFYADIYNEAGDLRDRNRHVKIQLTGHPVPKDTDENTLVQLIPNFRQFLQTIHGDSLAIRSMDQAQANSAHPEVCSAFKSKPD